MNRTKVLIEKCFIENAMSRFLNINSMKRKFNSYSNIFFFLWKFSIACLSIDLYLLNHLPSHKAHIFHTVIEYRIQYYQQ